MTRSSPSERAVIIRRVAFLLGLIVSALVGTVLWTETGSAIGAVLSLVCGSVLTAWIGWHRWYRQ